MNISSKTSIFRLDIIQNFGEFYIDNPLNSTSGSFVLKWYKEYQNIFENFNKQMKIIYEGYKELVLKKDEIINNFDEMLKLYE